MSSREGLPTPPGPIVVLPLGEVGYERLAANQQVPEMEGHQPDTPIEATSVPVAQPNLPKPEIQRVQEVQALNNFAPGSSEHLRFIESLGESPFDAFKSRAFEAKNICASGLLIALKSKALVPMAQHSKDLVLLAIPKEPEANIFDNDPVPSYTPLDFQPYHQEAAGPFDPEATHFVKEIARHHDAATWPRTSLQTYPNRSHLSDPLFNPRLILPRTPREQAAGVRNRVLETLTDAGDTSDFLAQEIAVKIGRNPLTGEKTDIDPLSGDLGTVMERYSPRRIDSSSDQAAPESSSSVLDLDNTDGAAMLVAEEISVTSNLTATPNAESMPEEHPRLAFPPPVCTIKVGTSAYANVIPLHQASSLRDSKPTEQPEARAVGSLAVPANFIIRENLRPNTPGTPKQNWDDARSSTKPKIVTGAVFMHKEPSAPPDFASIGLSPASITGTSARPFKSADVNERPSAPTEGATILNINSSVNGSAALTNEAQPALPFERPVQDGKKSPYEIEVEATLPTQADKDTESPTEKAAANHQPERVRLADMARMIGEIGMTGARAAWKRFRDR